MPSEWLAASHAGRALQPPGQLLMLVAEFARETVAKLLKKFLAIHQLLLPILRIYPEQLVHRIRRNVQPIQSERIPRRDVPNRCLLRTAASFDALQNPLQYAHVVPKTRPQEFSIRPFAEPVHMKNLRWMRNPLPHLQPMAELIGHVVSAERQHGHRIAPHDAHISGCGRGRLAGHGRAHEYSVLPIKSLVHQWRNPRPPSAKNKS